MWQSMGRFIAPLALTLVLAMPALAVDVTGGQEAEFPGWQAMLVLMQEDGMQRLRLADVTGDGRQELLLVNTRQSRLEIYQWLPPEQRLAPGEPNPTRPNELPVAAEFRSHQIPMDQLPRDLLAADLTGDGRVELIVLVSSPNRVLVFE
jgi:hypothetical protein